MVTRNFNKQAVKIRKSWFANALLMKCFTIAINPPIRKGEKGVRERERERNFK